MPNKQFVTISVTIKPEQKKLVEKLADSKERSVSFVIRQAIDNLLSCYELETPTKKTTALVGPQSDDDPGRGLWSAQSKKDFPNTTKNKNGPGSC